MSTPEADAVLQHDRRVDLIERKHRARSALVKILGSYLPALGVSLVVVYLFFRLLNIQLDAMQTLATGLVVSVGFHWAFILWGKGIFHPANGLYWSGRGEEGIAIALSATLFGRLIRLALPLFIVGLWAWGMSWLSDHFPILQGAIPQVLLLFSYPILIALICIALGAYCIVLGRKAKALA